MSVLCKQATSAWNEKGRQLRQASLILDTILCYLSARLVQYHEVSLLLQPIASPAVVHSL
jgi:hypothetical protein